MTSIWLIVAVVILAMLFAFAIAFGVYQAFKNARLEGRIQSIGAQFRTLPKRKTDRDKFA